MTFPVSEYKIYIRVFVQTFYTKESFFGEPMSESESKTKTHKISMKYVRKGSLLPLLHIKFISAQNSKLSRSKQ